MADTGDHSQTFSSWMCWRRGGGVGGSGLSREEELRRGSIEVVALPMISGQTNQSWSATIRPYNDVIKDIGGVTTATQRIVY